ncbi:uncharacterized protein LOC135077867 [Ostrinia nubilalis]|uniref:uncharacterized protein LOC114366407 n=1 Tax=Ostrinia furnacalis TaxID=93504 RepID=UPI001039CC9D|nr:uncharacterized protein LOC114366407 [Ostrinia furnacalis]
MYCDWPVLQRCCFCMPLRRGVLVVAYLNVLFCGFMVGVYSYAVHISLGTDLVYHGTNVGLPAELCIFIYLLELGFNALLIYGAHMRIKKYVRIYYYFALCTTLTTVVLGLFELTAIKHMFVVVELVLLMFAGLCIQIYMLVLVWNLLQKLEDDGPNIYENQLHQIINGQVKVEANGVYNPSTTIPHGVVEV